MRNVKKVLLAAFLSALLYVISMCSVFAEESFKLHLLDVGQGQCVLIEAEGHYMLIDGGGRSKSSYVVSYLKQMGIDTLDYAVVSHYDEDHMAGMIGVLSVFKIDTLFVPGHAGEGDLYESLAVSALSNGCTILHGKAGEEFALGAAAAEVIGPVGEYDLENDRSLALRITYGQTAYLICGDAEQQSEMDMLGSGAALKADVYIANHHGSSTSSMDSFLDAVSPRYVLISCGSDNPYGHPSMETMQRLRNHGCMMFRTDRQGTITASSDGTSIWFDVEPCADWTAGNGIINLERTGSADAEELERLYTGEEDRAEEESELSFRYVCNTNTKKFHYPDCDSVNQMKEENRLYTDLEREELIGQGYEPCGNCRP